MSVVPASKINVSDEVPARWLPRTTISTVELSRNFTKSYKEGDFVDKRSGNSGYKQEAKYTSVGKYVDNTWGYTTVYRTQLKVTKSFYTKKCAPAPKSGGYKRLNYY